MGLPGDQVNVKMNQFRLFFIILIIFIIVKMGEWKAHGILITDHRESRYTFLLTPEAVSD
jgi:hypothetical protein